MKTNINHFNIIKKIKGVANNDFNESLINSNIIDANSEYKNKQLKLISVEALNLTTAPKSGIKTRGHIDDIKLKMRNENLNNKKLVIKNIRCSNQSIIECIEINVHGSRASWIDNTIDGTFDVMRHILGINDDIILPFGLTSNGNYLPLIEDYIEIGIKFKDFGPFGNINNELNALNFVILYELHELCDEYAELKFITPSFQFTGIENEIGNLAKIKLGFHNIISHIFFTISKSDGESVEIEKLTLTFTESNKPYVLNPSYKKFKNFYIIEFIKSLALENINELGINFNIDSILFNCLLKNNVNDVIDKNDSTNKIDAIETNNLHGNFINIFALGQQVYIFKNNCLKWFDTCQFKDIK